MANQPQQRVAISQPGPYCLPDDLKFVGLFCSQGTEIVRIRFSRGSATTLDFPLSAETLSALASALSPLFGLIPEEMPPEIQTLKKQGAIRET